MSRRLAERSRSLTIIKDESVEEISSLSSSITTIRFEKLPSYEQVKALPATFKIIESNYAFSIILGAKLHVEVRLLNPITHTYELSAQAGKRKHVLA